MIPETLRRWVILAMAVLALASSSLAARAETVLLTRGDNDFGLGWLFLDSKGQCRIATPRHVIDTGESLVAPDLIDSFGRQHATANPRAAQGDLDLAFLEVLGALPQTGCTMSRLSGASLQTIVDRMEAATLAVATLYERQTIPVTKRASSQDELGGAIIAFSATDQGQGFQRGMSGGAIMLSGRPIGMLLEVDTEIGVGIALRFDVIAEAYASLSDQPSQSTPKSSSGQLDAITIMSGQTVGSDAGLGQYLAGRSDLVVSPAKDRIVLLVSLPKRQVLDGLHLEGVFPEGSAVIIETADQTTGFLYAQRCLLSAQSECRFSPRHADQLKLTFPGNPGDTLRFAGISLP